MCIRKTYIECLRKTVLLFAALAFAFGGSTFARADGNEIRQIIVDGTPMPEGSLAFKEGSTFVVADAIADVFNANVKYGEEAYTAEINCGGLCIVYEADVGIVQVNGTQETLDIIPFIRSGKLFVPIEDVIERLGIEVQILDGICSINSPFSLQLGISRASVKNALGEPARQELSERGYKWMIYPGGSVYRMIAADDEGMVTAFYQQRGNWSLECGLQHGMKPAECENALGSRFSVRSFGSYIVYYSTGEMYTVYFDSNECAYAVMAETGRWCGKFEISEEVINAFSQEYFEMMNAERMYYGKEELKLNSAICDAAKAHSDYLSRLGHLNHNNDAGLSPTERLVNVGVSAPYEAECISAAYPNSAAAFSGLMSDDGFNEMLRVKFTDAGVGITYLKDSVGLLYYVQQFAFVE